MPPLPPQLLHRLGAKRVLRHGPRFSTISTPRLDTVTVPARSNGLVQLSILQAPAPRSPSPLLLYLPAGPLFPPVGLPPPHHENDVAAALSASANATVVCVHYRLDNDQHQYPTPIHDVLTAYDWVLENFAPTLAARPRLRSLQLGVCGELVGGGLATMLALTECRMGKNRVAAAAVNNPIVNWIFPTDLLDAAEYTSRLGDVELFANDEHVDADVQAGDVALAKTSWGKYRDNPALPVAALTRARKAFFSTPDGYFDRFASPIHFFRTPEIGEVIRQGYDEDDDLAGFEMPRLGAESPTSFREPGAPVFEKRRRARRLFPPTGGGLRLPPMRVSVGAHAILHDQGQELVKLMRRSISRDEKSDIEAELRVRFAPKAGAGLWTGPARASNWRMEVEALGRWFRSTLA
ncbi:uncharacterized protein K452DRAFT_289987 [Aplosporella prunicola CBS 121167]|uniref:Alpha/beta hydrolase fold-3 domain-containing protein n=1 Tax=Aplosporella prunicola CBS 121167 TaxID=1176127 RepID=A0A6A6B966_9PEZI|nr:uncharacterized protein K452DRAFT_289987 [Aplosporella prunicola CBS 121167]KAF2139427.1 hypothetical protein K452DRAFT_289987 [Aplosporella prunicola CBS 121167]